MTRRRTRRTAVTQRVSGSWSEGDWLGSPSGSEAMRG
jgi:hypothetical protein